MEKEPKKVKTGAGKVKIRFRWLHVILFIAGVVLLGVFMKFYQPAA